MGGVTGNIESKDRGLKEEKKVFYVLSSAQTFLDFRFREFYCQQDATKIRPAK